MGRASLPAPKVTAPGAETTVPQRPSTRQTQEIPHLVAVERRSPVPPAPPRAMRIEREGAPTLTLVLYADREYLFGRSDDCSVVVASDSVSRQHGRLAFSDSDQLWRYRDLNSTNGSWLLDEAEAGRKLGTTGRVAEGRDRVVRAGHVLFLGSQRGRITFLPEPPPEALEPSLGGKSRAARELDHKVDVCARHRLPVFLLGPSGSGKTYFARRLHEQSGATGQFALVNCARLSADHAQLTSELLGHVKGAFTGAAGERRGRLAAANGGTLFLDEVESMNDDAQGFLLDLLEGSGSWAPLGAPPTESWPAPRFRLVSASKIPLGESGLRADLVHRLLLGEIIELPSLEQRREDIPALVHTFLKQLESEQQLQAELTADAVEHLCKARWPGQVRELQTTVRVVVSQVHAEREMDGLSHGRLLIGVKPVREYLERRARGLGAMRSEPRREVEGPTRKRPADLELADLESALAQSRGNKTRAAKLLGIAVNTLKAKLRMKSRKS
jgi:DNA-binding NtrC family response regulator